MNVVYIVPGPLGVLETAGFGIAGALLVAAGVIVTLECSIRAWQLLQRAMRGL